MPEYSPTYVPNKPKHRSGRRERRVGLMRRSTVGGVRDDGGDLGPIMSIAVLCKQWVFGRRRERRLSVVKAKWVATNYCIGVGRRGWRGMLDYAELDAFLGVGARVGTIILGCGLECALLKHISVGSKIAVARATESPEANRSVRFCADDWRRRGVDGRSASQSGVTGLLESPVGVYHREGPAEVRKSCVSSQQPLNNEAYRVMD
ncbi:hypothetical protein Tco_1447048 [Tanacetum coccineum]